ncbi:MAG: ParB/RepB/Spo0J family partition protein [Candidatus Liptonbacteria bacterium]|nr:ParB/RepB/Spo0J family partition protein [Candidatus Liptonbacteria bacterium]
MLGKGLESLIPKKDDGGGNAPSGDTQPTPGNRQAASNVEAANNTLQQKDDSREKNESKVVGYFDGQPIRKNTSQPVHDVPDNFGDVQQSPQKKNRRSDVTDSVFHIEIDKIHPNPHQPRRHFDEDALKDLASSIREFGILQPIVVSKSEKEIPDGADVEYELIAGERRWLASKMLGLERIPAIVRNINLERERLELAIIENVQREDLNPIERARAFARLQDEFRLTQREIASRLGKSRETVANTVRLLDLPAAMAEALEKNQISESHGRLLLSIEDPAAQQRIFRELLDKKMTTRDLKNKVRAAKTGTEETETEEIGPEIKMFQEKLSAELGAPVKIESKGEQGKITITFFSPEELQSIINKLGKDE